MAKLIRGVNSLDVLFPAIAAEWDYEKNYPLKPEDFTAYSNKKVWWKCKHGHSWQAKINNRANGNNCPYCSGRRVIPDINSLNVLFPAIAVEWDYEKNYPLRPENFTIHSGKKIWWKCKFGHSWQAVIQDRTRGNNCPYCAGKLPIPNVTSLDVLFPDIVAEFDMDKNYPLTPQNFTAYSNKKVWWICKKRHSWKATIADRTQGSNCPYCSGNLPIPNITSLDVLFPDVADEFDMDKNYPMTPQDFTAHSGKKVWWKCKHGHSWQATIDKRTQGRNCPYCSGRLPIPNITSLDVLFPAIAAEFDIDKNYPLTPQDFTAQSHKKIWWKCEHGHSWQATIANRTLGKGCPFCSGRLPIPNITSLDVLFPAIAAEFDMDKNYPLTPQDLTAHSDKKIWWMCKLGHSWQATVDNRTKGSGCPYCAGKLPIPNVTSLDVLFPDIAAEFDMDKNYPLTPQDFTAYSNKKAWWKCNQGHSWRAVVASRTQGRNCPYCAGQKKY